jgi:hypothetical protein
MTDLDKWNGETLSGDYFDPPSEGPGGEEWHASVVAALADHVDPDDWTADEWGNLTGTGWLDDCEATWSVDLDGQRIEVVVGMLEVMADVTNDDHELAARRLLGAVRGWESAE